MKLIDEYINLYRKYTQQYGKIALLYQCGDFYEMFDTEAHTDTNAQQICKDVGLRMGANLKAGFPCASLNAQIPKFTVHNYTIVIYDQQDNPNYQKGKTNEKIRTLNKIISPGLYMDDNTQNDDRYILSVYIEYTELIYDINICALNVITGKCVMHSIINEAVDAIDDTQKIIQQYSPKEILWCYQSDMNEFSQFLLEKKYFVRTITPSKQIYNHTYQDEFLNKVFPYFKSNKVSPVEFLGIEKYNNMVVSLINLLNFAYEQDATILSKLHKPQLIENSKYLKFSANTIKQLNIINDDATTKSVFDILNKTHTVIGKRLLKEKLLYPVISADALNKQYDEVERFLSKKAYLKSIIGLLSGVKDLDKLHRKIFLKKLLPYELCYLNDSYSNILKLLSANKTLQLLNVSASHTNKVSALHDNKVNSFKKMVSFYREFINLEEIGKCDSITDMTMPIFIEGKYANLDELYQKYNTAMDGLKEYAKHLSLIVDKSDANTVKIEYTQSEGYFFVTTAKRYQAIKDVSEFDITKRASVKLTDIKIRHFSKEILEAQSDIRKLNKEAYLNILTEISDKYSECLKYISNIVSHIDVVVSQCLCILQYKYCKPSVGGGDTTTSYVQMQGMRHLIVERINENEKFISNDIALGKDVHGVLLYGVNGCGKSILLKSVGLCMYLAQCGFYVPCKAFAFSPFKKLFTKIMMDDNLYKGQSTYVKEMQDINNMLLRGDANTLVLADELCSGTTHLDALSIVGATIHQLSSMKTNFIFTTHLHELNKIPLVNKLENVKCMHLSSTIIDGELVYGRKLEEGSGSEMYGIEIAKFLKIGDNNFIANAQNIRNEMCGTTRSAIHSRSTMHSTGILPTKTSKYNSSVYIDKCVKCGSVDNLQTDHITRQSLADEYGNIDTFNKNSKFNLQILCDKCHKIKTKQESK